TEALKEQTIEVDFFGKKVKSTPRVNRYSKKHYYPDRVTVCLPTGQLKTINLAGKIVVKEGNHLMVYFPTAIIRISKNESVVKLGLYDEDYKIHYFTTVQDDMHTVINDTFIERHDMKVKLAVKELSE